MIYKMHVLYVKYFVSDGQPFFLVHLAWPRDRLYKSINAFTLRVRQLMYAPLYNVHLLSPTV